jgi:hypothetical protein
LDPTAFPAADYTLADLLGRGEFGFRLVVAPEGWADQVVAGGHSLESDDPAEWLDRDWVMLTTGVLLPREAGEQRRFIAEFDEAGATALGLEVGWELADVAACPHGHQPQASSPPYANCYPSHATVAHRNGTL